MRSSSLLLSTAGFLLAATLHAAPPAAGQHDHAMGHHGHAMHAAGSTQAPATRWATDAPLRDGMGQVRVALDELRHHEMGHMSEGQARERAATIETAVQSMFAQCKLAPDADAALHAILVPLLAAAQRLDKDPADKAAVVAMREAVAPYPAQFGDPQWPADAQSQSMPHDHMHCCDHCCADRKMP